MLTSCSSDDPVINTTPIIQEVLTDYAEVTATSAIVYGSVVGLKSQAPSSYTVGVVYSLNENPTVSGSKTIGELRSDGATVIANINGLQSGNTYYYATFVSLQGIVTEYGEVKSFYTTDAAVGTAAPASVTAVSANLSGTLNGVQSMLYAETLEYGIAIAPLGVPVQEGVKLLGEGISNSFNIAATGLVPNTEYTFAAFMVLNTETVYGNEQTLQTPFGILAKEESANDYVDMGTKMQWCRYNVGAMTESAPGALLGYGDLTGFNNSLDLNKYATGNISNTDYDVAVASGMGVMPTVDDWNQLLAVCDQAPAVKDGVSGIELTSRVTGNKIFLPAAGKREGAAVDSNDICYYWTGNASETNGDYAIMFTDNQGMQSALRSTGALVRPVRREYVPEIVAHVTKLAIGDLEGNGRIRIEIYNEYGSTNGNCGIDVSSIVFEKQMVVDFTISGITGNLKEGAKGSYRAGLEFADASWDPSYWSAFDGNNNDCLVMGDGSYRVKFDTENLSEGAVVFCIDINGLGADLVDPTLVKVDELKIQLDPKKALYADVAVDNNSIWYGNKEDNGTDVRVEFYNEYGPTNASGAGDLFPGIVFGRGTTTASVNISGIDGNLKAGAAGEYTGAMSLACAGWWPSFWGGGASDQVVKADGTYSFPAYLEANGTGTVVWVIDIAGLWGDLVDPSLLKVEVNNVVTPVHPE